MKDLQVEVLNIKGGKAKVLLSDFLENICAKLTNNQMIESVVINKNQNITTTILYFDIDDFQDNINTYQ